jgi:hypothetical protein
MNIYKDPTPFTPKHLQAIIRKFNYNQHKKIKINKYIYIYKSKTPSKNPCKITKELKNSTKTK